MKNDPRVITKDKLNTNYLTKIKKKLYEKNFKKENLWQIKTF